MKNDSSIISQVKTDKSIMRAFSMLLAVFFVSCSSKQIGTQEVIPSIGGLRVIEVTYGRHYKSGGVTESWGQLSGRLKNGGYGYEYFEYLLNDSPLDNLEGFGGSDPYITIHRGMSIQTIESKLGSPISEYFNVLPTLNRRSWSDLKVEKALYHAITFSEFWTHSRRREFTTERMTKGGGGLPAFKTAGGYIVSYRSCPQLVFYFSLVEVPVNYIDLGVAERRPGTKNIVSALEEIYNLGDTGSGKHEQPPTPYHHKFWGLHKLSKSETSARIVRGKRIR